jgi:proteasome activator-like protein
MAAETASPLSSPDGARDTTPPLPADPEALQGTVEQPAKLLRIAVMVRELLEEVRRAPVDENARQHLRDIHSKVIAELKTGLSGALAEELDRISLPLPASGVPSESEIRIAQAQLLGWLEGLFQGIQAAIATQQLAAQAQLMEMRRRGLPPGMDQDGGAEPSSTAEGRPPGQYL